MSEQGWSEWFEHKLGDPCPVPWARPWEWEYKNSAGKNVSATGEIDLYEDAWGGSLPDFKIARYRYRLDCAPAGFAPPGAEKPWEEAKGDPRLWPAWEPRTYEVRLNGGFVFTPQAMHLNECNRNVVAYRRLKLEDQPTQEQVEATQEPETPQDDALDDEDPDNQPMFTHDAAGIDEGCWARFNARQAWQRPTDPAPAMVSPIRSSDGLLTVREADHRLGDWQ